MYVLQENVPSFDRSIDTTLLQSTCEEVGQDLVSKLWFSAPGPNHTAPHRTVPNRTYTHVHGSLMVRSWFALGSPVVLLRYSTVTVRYFNFFLTGTVHVHVRNKRNTFNFQNTNLKIQKRKYYLVTQEQCVYMYMYVYIEVLYVHCTYSRHEKNFPFYKTERAVRFGKRTMNGLQMETKRIAKRNGPFRFYARSIPFCFFIRVPLCTEWNGNLKGTERTERNFTNTKMDTERTLNGR